MTEQPETKVATEVDGQRCPVCRHAKNSPKSERGVCEIWVEDASDENYQGYPCGHRCEFPVASDGQAGVPERIWIDPAALSSSYFEQFLGGLEYVRADLARVFSDTSTLDKRAIDYLRGLVRMELRKKKRGLENFERREGQSEGEAAQVKAEFEA